MSTFLRAWLASENAQRDAIAVKKVYIDINDGSLYSGVLFSQIMYWHGSSLETGKPRMTIMRDGFYWLAKKYSEWWDECRINEYTAKAEITKMIKRQLLIKALYKFDGVPTVHIRVNPVEFELRISSIGYIMSNGIDTGYLTDSIPHVQSLTETTPKTTSKKNTSSKAVEAASTGGKPFVEPVDAKLKEQIAIHVQRIDPAAAGKYTGVLAQLAAGVWRNLYHFEQLSREQYAAVSRSIELYVEDWHLKNPDLKNSPTDRGKFETAYSQFVSDVKAGKINPKGKREPEDDGWIEDPDNPGVKIKKFQLEHRRSQQEVFGNGRK